MIRASRPLFSLPVAALFCGQMAVAGAEDASVVTEGGISVAVPSGQPVTLQDVIANAPGPEGLTLRFRFLAPAIAGSVDFDTAAADMQHLCDSFAIPRLAEIGPQAQQVVISLSSEAVPFGEPAPDVVQFFESYRIEGDSCVWEMF